MSKEAPTIAERSGTSLPDTTRILGFIKSNQTIFKIAVERAKSEAGTHLQVSMLSWLKLLRRDIPNLPEHIDLKEVNPEPKTNPGPKRMVRLDTDMGSLTLVELAGEDEEPEGTDLISRSYQDLVKKPKETIIRQLGTEAWLDYAKPAVLALSKAVADLPKQQKPE